MAEKVHIETEPEPEVGVWNPHFPSHSLFNQPAKCPRFPHRGNSESIGGCWKGPYQVLGSQNDGCMAGHSEKNKWALDAQQLGRVTDRQLGKGSDTGSKNKVQASGRIQSIIDLWKNFDLV